MKPQLNCIKITEIMQINAFNRAFYLSDLAHYLGRFWLSNRIIECINYKYCHYELIENIIGKIFEQSSDEIVLNHQIADHTRMRNKDRKLIIGLSFSSFLSLRSSRYSPDPAPSDYHLFGSMSGLSGNQTVQGLANTLGEVRAFNQTWRSFSWHVVWKYILSALKAFVDDTFTIIQFIELLQGTSW